MFAYGSASFILPVVTEDVSSHLRENIFWLLKKNDFHSSVGCGRCSGCMMACIFFMPFVLQVRSLSDRHACIP